MSGRGQLFIGRLPLECRERDVEQVFERYGRLLRCDVKYGTGMAYAFVDYEDHRDAEDAVKYENGREIRGQSVVVEWARGPSFRPPASKSFDECYRCRRTGHWARDCPEGDSRDRPYHPSRRSRSRSRSRSPQRSYRRSRHSRSRSRSSSRRRSWSRSPSPRESRHRSRKGSGEDRRSSSRGRRGNSRSQSR